MLSSFYKVSKLAYKKTAGAGFGSSFVRPAFAGLCTRRFDQRRCVGADTDVDRRVPTRGRSLSRHRHRQYWKLCLAPSSYPVRGRERFCHRFQSGGLTGAFNPFTSEQGSWNCERSPLRSPVATATVLDFSLPGSVAGSQTIARGDYQISFAPGPQTISGSIALRFFPLTGNPLAKPLRSVLDFHLHWIPDKIARSNRQYPAGGNTSCRFRGPCPEPPNHFC